MYIIFGLMLFSIKQINGICNKDGKSCQWNQFTHQCGCQNLGLTCIPQNIIECPNMIALQLQNNNITRINSSDLYSYSSRLQELVMNNNQIKSIASGSFQNMAHLLDIFIIGNQLTSLQNGIFNGLPSLRELYLSANKIKYIENDVFNVLTNLKILDLSGNDLSELSTNIFSKSPLIKLDLSYNIFANIPEVLHSMSKLESLDLRENRISYVRRDIFSELTELAVLRLDSNNITEIESSTLANRIKLQALYLSKNNIRSLNPQILWGDGEETFDLLGLNLLDVSENNLTEIQKDFMRHLPAIQTLNLSGNKIQHIEPESFSNMRNLTYLKLRQNKLKYFDSDIFKGEDLTSKMLCKDPKTFPFLQELNIEDNQLKTAPSEELFRMLPSLQFLDIVGNPLVCNCDILGLVKWFNNTKHTFPSKYYLGKCSMPKNLEGTPIAMLDSSSVAGPCKGATINNRESPIIVSPGEKVMINCNSTGFPQPNVCWKIPRNLRSGDLDITKEHIVIGNISGRYEGVYVCQTENVLKNDSVSYKLLMGTFRHLTTTSPSKFTALVNRTESVYINPTTAKTHTSKQNKLETFLIITSFLLFFTVIFIIYMVRCHGNQSDTCRSHDTEPDKSNRIARDQRRVYKTLVEETAEENIEILNIEQ